MLGNYVTCALHAPDSAEWERVVAAQVIMRVPMEYCLVVNYDGDGVSLPNSAWPRLREAVQDNPELPWDLLLVSVLPDPCRYCVFDSQERAAAVRLHDGCTSLRQAERIINAHIV